MNPNTLPLLAEKGPFPWEHERRAPRADGRPWVTVTYAQSVDGCIAGRGDAHLELSGPEALVETHRLRASHDAILVGIGTVRSDNPRLTVRLVQGNHPRPVVLDSQLRFPLTARMLAEPSPMPLVFTAAVASIDRQAMLAELGIEVVRLPAERDGLVRLADVVNDLGSRGFRSVMVEGGAGVISRFLRCRLVDDLVVTIAPCLARGGLKAIGDFSWKTPRRPLPIQPVQIRRAGKDVILYGKPFWSDG